MQKSFQEKINFFSSFVWQNNIKQLANIIKFSDIHITNDNGSMHVASIFSKKNNMHI